MNKKVLAAIIIVNIVLVGTIVAIYFTVFYDPSQPRTSENWQLTIAGEIEQELGFNITELEQLPSITRSYIMKGHPTFTANYTGVTLWHLITVVANVTESVSLKIIAADYYFYLLDFDQITNSTEAMIAYKKNYDYIPGPTEGGNGPLRLILPQSFVGEWNAQFCVKFVNRIEIQAKT